MATAVAVAWKGVGEASTKRRKRWAAAGAGGPDAVGRVWCAMVVDTDVAGCMAVILAGEARSTRGRRSEQSEWTRARIASASAEISGAVPGDGGGQRRSLDSTRLDDCAGVSRVACTAPTIGPLPSAIQSRGFFWHGMDDTQRTAGRFAKCSRHG